MTARDLYENLLAGASELPDEATSCALALPFDVLHRSIDEIAGDGSVSSVLSPVLEDAVRLVGATGGLISTMQPSDGCSFCPVAIAWGGERLSVERWTAISGITSEKERSDEDPAGFFACIRRADELAMRVECPNVPWWPGALPFMRRVGIARCLAFPVISRNSVAGLLELWLPWREMPVPRRMAQLRVAAHQAAFALELIQLRERTSKAATEAERERVAGEIHDGLAQGFLAILMQARAAKMSRRQHRCDAYQYLDRIELLAADGLEEARRSSFALRSHSVENNGLVAALEGLVANISIDGRTRCSFVKADSKFQTTSQVEDVIYRIVQESTQNALKHAEAQEVEVRLEQTPRGLELTIQDDGIGIPNDVVQQARERGGLRAMRDRAQRCGGELVVESRAPRGTCVWVVFPAMAV